MEVWLGAVNPAGTVYEYHIECLFSVPKYLSADIGEL